MININSEAFSYIEVLIAGALLSIFLVPVLSGFYQASNSLNNSILQYRSTLYAKNLMLESEEALNKNNILTEPLTQVGEFDYALKIYELGSNGTWSISEFVDTDLNINPVDNIEASGLFLEEYTGSDYVIYYDNDFVTAKGDLFISDNILNYSGASDTTVDIIFKQADYPVRLIINNTSNSILYVNIYTDTTYNLQVEFADSDKNSIVSYSGYAPKKSVVLTAEIYNESGALLSRMISAAFKEGDFVE